MEHTGTGDVKEEDLICQARGGDLKSFSALVERYQDRAIHVAYSFLGNFEDARDVAQEAFVRAHQNFFRFGGRSSFYTWFYRLLVNGCKDFLRRKKTRREANDPDPLENFPASTRDARMELADQELEREIYRALGELPFQQRNVFTLRYLEGFKLEEIAGTLNLSLGAVKAHLWQAGQKMKQKLSDHFPGGGF